jgi:hypothetical protein
VKCRNEPAAPHWVAAGSLATGRIEEAMNSVIYIVGLVVVVIAVLSFFGLR